MSACQRRLLGPRWTSRTPQEVVVGYPDRNFNTAEGNELTQQLNAARAILKMAMLRGAPPDIDVSMAGF